MQKMTPYKNNSGNSIVQAYQLKPNGIVVKFTDGATYECDNQHTGKQHIKHMQQFAEAGEGLGTYIQTVTKYGYAKQTK